MKATVNTDVKVFVPFSITIILESQLEVDELSAAARHTTVFPRDSAHAIHEALNSRASANCFDALYKRIDSYVR